MADALEGIVGLVPPLLATGLVLGTLGIVSKMSGPMETTSMKDYKIRSVQDMI